MSSIMGFLGDILSAAGSSVAMDEENAYEDRVKAYERELKRIQDDNTARSERVQRRNQLMSVVGSDNRFLQPKETALPSKPDEADYDVAEALNTFGSLVGGMGEMGGGGLASSDTGPYTSQSSGAPPSTLSINTNTESDGTALAYSGGSNKKNRGFTSDFGASFA